MLLARRVAADAGAGLGGLGKTRARRYAPEEGKRTTFADVAGINQVEVAETVDFLCNPGRYTSLGAAMPRGVLLAGPPGTGKTLLARAVAGEAQVPFFFASASEFIELVVGVGASPVRDLFEQAKEAPAIIVVDELDAIGRARGGAASIGGNDEREQDAQPGAHRDGRLLQLRRSSCWRPRTARRCSTRAAAARALRPAGSL